MDEQMKCGGGFCKWKDDATHNITVVCLFVIIGINVACRWHIYLEYKICLVSYVITYSMMYIQLQYFPSAIYIFILLLMKK